MPTFFSFALLLGVPTAVAGILHGAVALAVTAAVAWIWLRCENWSLRSAALVVATLLVNPYLFDYDLAWLALSIAWFAVHGMRYGWLRWEREVLVIAWLLPLAYLPIYALTGAQLAPFALLGFFLVILRRVLRDIQEREANGLRSSLPRPFEVE